jgi:hypothetical protein
MTAGRHRRAGGATVRIVFLVRYGIPLSLFVAGAVVAATSGRVGLAAGAMFMSAATAVLLLNVLFRIGVQGDKDRDREEAARRFFDEHGRWPDEPESAARRRPTA